MREYKKIKKEIESEILNTLSCCICGKKNKRQVECDWGSSYDVNETTVARNNGSAYPTGGSGVKEIYDICSECFDDKVKPFLESLGAVPYVEEWDF